MYRAIRSAAGLNTSYSRNQLLKPFIAVKLAADPSSELGGHAALAALYGGAAAMFGPPQPRVIDAEIEETVDSDVGEMEPPDKPTGEAAGAEGPAASDFEGIDPNTGEMLPGAPEVAEKVSDFWQDCREHGMSQDVFVELARSSTGKTRSADMTLEDAEVFGKAIGRWFDHRDHAQREQRHATPLG
jgi:hypothetical protein